MSHVFAMSMAIFTLVTTLLSFYSHSDFSMESNWRAWNSNFRWKKENYQFFFILLYFSEQEKKLANFSGMSLFTRKKTHRLVVCACDNNVTTAIICCHLTLEIVHFFNSFRRWKHVKWDREFVQYFVSMQRDYW